MLLMAEVYNAYVVARILHTCRQGCLVPVLHIAESTVLDIHLSNVEGLHYSNMCCGSLNNAAATTFTGTSHFLGIYFGCSLAHFFLSHMRLYFVLLIRQPTISNMTVTRLFIPLHDAVNLLVFFSTAVEY